MSADTLSHILALSQTPKVGPITFHALLLEHGTLDGALQAVFENDRFKEKPNLKKAEALLQEAQAYGLTVLSYDDPRYPDVLKSLRDAPPVLFTRGNLSLLSQKTVAFVGARNASYASQKLAYTLARDVAAHGYTVVSGFAKGVDISAHKGAQKTGSITVFAGGVDHIFPPEHESYVETFLETGLIVSEMPLGYRPSQQNFPRRNRLISGLSSGVVVVEAAHQSGSLITAEYALAHGREVGAVPGSPLDARCRGSNKLLKEGAHFVENSWDVLTFLNDLSAVSAAQKEVAKKASETTSDTLDEKILTLLSYSPIDLNDLLRQIPTKPQSVLSALSALELDGKINREPGNKVALKAP